MRGLVIVDHGKVAQAIYKYINFLKMNELPEEVFEEIKTLADREFRSSEPESGAQYASDLAYRLGVPVPRAKVISSAWLVEEFDLRAIRSILEDCLRIENSYIAISAKAVPPDIEGSFDSVEPIYRTRYMKQTFSQAFKEESRIGTLPPYALPRQNSFVPSGSTIASNKVNSPKLRTADPQVTPDLIVDTPILRLWHGNNDYIWAARAHIYLALKS